MSINEQRLRILSAGHETQGPVLYWMSRDQRVIDNWALIHAQTCAIKKKVPLIVCFCLVPDFLQASARHYRFMLKGLTEVETALHGKHIPFFLLRGSPEAVIPAFIRMHKVSMLITDFDPLKIKRRWKQAVCRTVGIPVHEVDARNIVPCWIASSKQEYAAYTFRPKMNLALPEFLEEFPRIKKHPFIPDKRPPLTDWQMTLKNLKADGSVPEIDWIIPGERAALKALKDFISIKLPHYAGLRNDPVKDRQSNLSPYLHFGHLSAQRAAIEVKKTAGPSESKDAFLEELIIRRELSDNFCFYNEHYDSFEGFPAWAKETLNQHRGDRRPYLYALGEFENATTNDDLWNAAQIQMLKTGKMHGHMRMYWAKKILEWTESPEQAMEFAIYLNDRYELDGRDPNGYAGISWSIGGVHDRAWGERSIFGKVRYMSYLGCKGKFDTAAYMRHWS
jgi:deoxyribodipyrimidine photo-lyase